MFDPTLSLTSTLDMDALILDFSSIVNSQATVTKLSANLQMKLLNLSRTCPLDVPALT